MALESRLKLTEANFSVESDFIEVFSKKAGVVGVIHPNQISSPSGVSGAIQFSNGSAFASDATNLFWDDTNNRLGVGTNTPTSPLQVVGTITTQNLFTSGVIYGNSFWLQENGVMALGQQSAGTAKLFIKGSGSTSATTALLVQNSAGNSALTILDNLNSQFGGTVTSDGGFRSIAYFDSFQRIALNNGINTNPQNYLISGGIGRILLVDNSEADFNRLQFGGTTSAFPSLKRASNNFEVKNADDTFGAGLSVGGALNASSILQADSTTRGFLPPRMTTTQKNAIATPASGLVVYDSTTNKLCCYNGSTWNDLF